jgi:hypothetical protein
VLPEDRERAAHNNDDKNGSVSEGLLEVIERALDKVGLPEDVLVDLHARGQCLLQIIQHRV